MVTRREMVRTFLWIGLTSYGGPAIVAQIRQVTVLQKKWLTEEEFQETLAFVQTIPGPVAVQSAAHIGWRLYGGLGALLALTAYVLPCFLLMLGLSAAYFRFESLPLVTAIFTGLGAAVVGIVVDSILSMAQPSLKDWRGVVLAVVAATGFLVHLNALVVLLGSAVLGLVMMAGTRRPDGGGAADPPPASSGWKSPAALALVAALFAGGVWAMGLLSPVLPALGTVMVKVNLLAFGGGYTAVALMHDQVVTGLHWITTREFVDGLALGQITPGPVIMTATFIGYHQAGLAGALVATAAIFLPSGLLLVLLAPQFARIRRLEWVYRMVRGLLAAFIAMLFIVLWQMASASIRDLPTLLMAVGAIAVLRFKVNPAWVVVGAVLLSLVLFR